MNNKFICRIGLSVENIEITNHCQKRMSQRNVTLEDLLNAIAIGSYYHNAGVILVFVGKKDIPKEFRKIDKMQRLLGLNILIANDKPQECSIITVYKNKNGFGEFKKKSKCLIPKTKPA